MATKLDLADAQFIGYKHGKYQSLLEMVSGMGLTKKEYLKWRRTYTVTLSEAESIELDNYFQLTNKEKFTS